MAYKFQLGAATLSGSTTFEESLTTQGVLEGSSLISKSTISGSAALQGASVSVEGAASVGSLDANSGGITNAGAIAGATSIDGSGDLTMGTITMTGFAVDADGDTALKSLAVDDGSTIGPDSVADLLTLAGAGHITVKDGAYDFDIAAHDGTNGLKLGGTLVTSTAAELNYVDVSSVGTVEASKAVVVDGSKDASGFRNVTAEGALVSATVSGSGQLSGQGLRLDTNGVIGTAGDTDLLTLKNGELSVAGNVGGANLSGSGTLKAGGTVQFDGVADAAADVTADSLYFLDGDGLMKKESFVDYASSLASAAAGMVAESGSIGVNAGDGLRVVSNALAISPSDFTGTGLEVNSDDIRIAASAAGDGLSGGGGSALALDLNELTAADVSVANDSIAIIDANDSNGSRKESIVDFIAAVAGSGLVASNGQLSTDGAAVALKADGDDLVTGVNYFASASANATVDLPASPSVGDRVTAKAAELGDGSKIIIRRQGSHVIDDDQTQIEIESPFGAVTLVYVVANEWRII